MKGKNTKVRKQSDEFQIKQWRKAKPCLSRILRKLESHLNKRGKTKKRNTLEERRAKPETKIF